MYIHFPIEQIICWWNLTRPRPPSRLLDQTAWQFGQPKIYMCTVSFASRMHCHEDHQPRTIKVIQAHNWCWLIGVTCFFKVLGCECDNNNDGVNLCVYILYVTRICLLPWTQHLNLCTHHKYCLPRGNSVWSALDHLFQNSAVDLIFHKQTRTQDYEIISWHGTDMWRWLRLQHDSFQSK